MRPSSLSPWSVHGHKFAFTAEILLGLKTRNKTDQNIKTFFLIQRKGILCKLRKTWKYLLLTEQLML